jgi:hypothetical protein
MISYDELKNELLNIKKRIDEEIKEKGITPNLINYEENLNKIYKKVKKVWGNEQNKEYINFNYFPCKAVISLAKGHHYSALKEWLEGFKNFIEYTNEVKDASKWLGSIDYYRSRYSYISEKRVEIFGSLPLVKFNEIITAFENVINAISPTNSLSIKIQETLIDAIDSIITNSTEIYTDEHLRRKNVLIDLLKKFDDKNNYIVGMKCRIEFILLKKELHYYIREILRGKEPDKSNLERVIKQMKEAAGREKNNFKKVKNGIKVDWKKVLSEIDVLVTKYYNTLWLQNNLLGAIKCLEQIFSKIRDNLNMISTPSMFQYFVNEFIFLQNYLKLLLLAKDFKDFVQKDGVYEWQKKLSEDISNEIISIAAKNFKYNISQDIRRSLFIVEESVSGKVLEFIIFYLLKELITNKHQALTKLNEIRDSKIRNFIELVLNSKSKEIKWSYKIHNTDIDIFISDKCAIFLKTGIIGSSDRKRIQKELEISKNCYVFYLLDIAKNLDVVKDKISKEDNRVKFIDIGKFLNEIYDFAKTVGVKMELSKSSIKSLTGFYS